VTQRLSLTSRKIDTFGMQRLSLISWNIDAFSSRPVARAKLILNHILEGPKSPDILFLQEVTPDVRASLLDDARVRAAFLATDAEDQMSFEDVPFATMTLLSRARFASGLDSQQKGDVIEGGEFFMIGRVSRVTLPSKFRRDALYVDIIPPTAQATVFRLINVHLDSRGDTLHYRAQQIEILANVLREPGCSGGIIAGDFNAIRPEDHGLVDKNELVDAWVALHGRADPYGATWGVGVERRHGLGPGRLDKVAMIGLKAK
jgi:tyrosyl-DNA phosphodiesterase 2